MLQNLTAEELSYPQAGKFRYFIYRFIFNGQVGSNGYTTKFIPQSIGLNSDFSAASWSITALAAGIDDITSEVEVILSAANVLFVPTVGIYTNKLAAYVQKVTTTSNVYFQVAIQSLSITEANTLSVTSDLTCTFSGSISITYSTSVSNIN